MSIDKQSAGPYDGSPNKTQEQRASLSVTGRIYKNKRRPEREGDEHRGDRPSSFLHSLS